MATSLSKLVNNLTEDIHNDKCIKCKSNLCYMKVTDKKLMFRYFDCKKNYEKEINKELVERFSNTYEFCYICYIVTKRCLPILIYGWMG